MCTLTALQGDGGENQREKVRNACFAQARQNKKWVHRVPSQADVYPLPGEQGLSTHKSGRQTPWKTPQMPWPHFYLLFQIFYFWTEYHVAWTISLLCWGQLCWLCPLQPPLWGGRLGRRKGLDTESTAQQCQYVNSVLVRKSKQHHREVMNRIPSMAGRASTAVFVRSLPAGWGQLSLHRGGHSCSNRSPSGSQGKKHVNKGKQISS